jgi:hypothetical protein
MSIYLLKSILALVMAALSVVSMITMFEVLGRKDRKFNIEKMNRVHRFSGILYFVIFAFVTYFCLDFILLTKAELSSRSTFHGLFALTIIVLFCLKLLYIRIYRQFYEHVKMIGVLMALMTFGMVGVSAGYYLLVSEMGTDQSFDKIMQYKTQLVLAKDKTDKGQGTLSVKTDPESIGRGKSFFDSKCKFCHKAYSTETIVGPGLQSILTNKRLPVSKRPATPENIVRQFKQPFNRMPSFEYLTEEEISDILAFLNTL